jgi:ankyrin repeat protein
VLYKTPGLGLSAVGIAAKNGHTQTLSLLLSCKADVNVTRNDNKRTPLHEAAANGNAQCIRLLLAAGSSTTARDGAGLTAAELAATCGASEATRVRCAGLFE